MKSSLLIFLIIALFIIIILGIIIIIFFINKDKNISKTSPITTPIKSNNTMGKINDIEEFISKADNAKNAQELHELILQFLNSQKFNSNPKDSATKRKLDFVSAISANANASPKNISFLNNELKKRYKTLKKEIDAYEQVGLAKRKMRQS